MIDPGVTVTDPDGSSITGATVQISANYAGAQDQLALSGVHPGITAAQVGDTLTLSGTASRRPTSRRCATSPTPTAPTARRRCCGP